MHAHGISPMVENEMVQCYLLNQFFFSSPFSILIALVQLHSHSLESTSCVPTRPLLLVLHSWPSQFWPFLTWSLDVDGIHCYLLAYSVFSSELRNFQSPFSPIPLSSHTVHIVKNHVYSYSELISLGRTLIYMCRGGASEIISRKDGWIMLYTTQFLYHPWNFLSELLVLISCFSHLLFV